jgi:hypothetical protein
MLAQFVADEMKRRFPTDSIIHALAVFDWRSLPSEDVPAVTVTSGDGDADGDGDKTRTPNFTGNLTLAECCNVA